MKFTKQLKHECKKLGLDYDTVVYNMDFLKNYKFFKDELYHTSYSFSGKPSFKKEFIKKVNLYDYV